jgi:23S rRNA pseudouridine2605 synthase
MKTENFAIMNEPPQDKSEVRPGERIAKVIARAGLCSRRDAEGWIAAGRVSVNGVALTSPAFNVGPDDDVSVDGEPLRDPERTRLFAFHKPRGLVTSARDPEGRPTVFDALPKELPRVVAVGRLDVNTEGLLLLTNDGGLARVLELPATGWLRRYRVRAHGAVAQDKLDTLSEGVTIEGVHYAGIEARLERQQGSNVWLTMGLREGKNREIKRVLEHLGLQVTRLIRVSFGPFELADLLEGAVQEIATRVLRDQLGVRLAKQAHANFEAPIESRRAEPEPPPRERPREDERQPPLRGPAREKEERQARREPREREARRDSRGNAPQRKRKHVSILRAEARAEADGERRRIERSATSDRKGRKVEVERISLARAPAPQPERKPHPQRPAPDGGRSHEFHGERAGGKRTERPSGERKPRFSAAPRGEKARGEGRPGGRERSGPEERGRGENFERKSRRFAPGAERAAAGEKKGRDVRDERGGETRPPRRRFERTSRPEQSFGERDRTRPREHGKPGAGKKRPPRGDGAGFKGSRPPKKRR